MSEAAPFNDLRFASETPSLGVSESIGSATELFEKNSVLFLEINQSPIAGADSPSRRGQTEGIVKKVKGG